MSSGPTSSRILAALDDEIASGRTREVAPLPFSVVRSGAPRSHACTEVTELHFLPDAAQLTDSHSPLTAHAAAALDNNNSGTNTGPLTRRCLSVNSTVEEQ